jgi:hypothetical protein
MFANAIRLVVDRPDLALHALSRPFSVWDSFRARAIRRREARLPPYTPDIDTDWECKLTHWLGVPLPTQTRAEFGVMWPMLETELAAKGIAVPEAEFDEYKPADEGFARAVWRLTRHLRPVNVVETGVALGVTSRFVLEAMDRNRAGRLWSIDRAPLDPAMRKLAGAAIGGRFPHRWALIEGAAQRRLPPLLDRLGQIDLFIHDSLHTTKNTRFEMDRAWTVLRPGGAMVVNAIDANWGFNAFVKTHRGFALLVCESEPEFADPRRFNGKGLFGIILKNPSADRLAARHLSGLRTA